MPVESQQLKAMYPVGDAEYVSYYYYQDWVRSPVVAGKLQLRSNPWSLQVQLSHRTNTHGGGPAPFMFVSFASTTNDPVILRAREVAESDLRGTLARRIKDKNVGSLGVSFASSAQSIGMLRGSATRLIGIFEAAERFYRTTRGRKRLKRFRRLYLRGAQPTAGLVLEGFFGWVPALQDFYSAAQTLANPWPPTSWVSASRRWNVGTQTISKVLSPYSKSTETWSATGHSTYATGVQVSNPNLWVANKLGILNPFQVAWDLVPWSFLVNMVSNMGQVMGSLTDFAGLAFTDSSLTTGLFMQQGYVSDYRDPRPGASASAAGTQTVKIRGRKVGVSPPGVVPYFRWPEWGVGTAAIVGSLLIQQTSRLSWALKPIFS